MRQNSTIKHLNDNQMRVEDWNNFSTLKDRIHDMQNTYDNIKKILNPSQRSNSQDRC